MKIFFLLVAKRASTHHHTTRRARVARVICSSVALIGMIFPTLAESASMIPNGLHFSEVSGPELYAAICQACHMADGKGGEGAGHYPALAANPNLAASGYILHNVLHGRHGMPGFKDELDDAQVAAVINHVRTHFGNQYTDAVTPEQVAQSR